MIASGAKQESRVNARPPPTTPAAATSGRAQTPTHANAASPIDSSRHRLVVGTIVLGIRGSDRDARHEWQWAARTVGARDQIVAARIERRTQSVTHRCQFDKLRVNLGQLHPRAGLHQLGDRHEAG